MFRKGPEMFRFPFVKSSLCFPNVKIVAVPATGPVNDSRELRTVETVLVWEEGFDAPGVLKNNFYNRVETINTRFNSLCNLITM